VVASIQGQRSHPSKQTPWGRVEQRLSAGPIPSLSRCRGVPRKHVALPKSQVDVFGSRCVALATELAKMGLCVRPTSLRCDPTAEARAASTSGYSSPLCARERRGGYVIVGFCLLLTQAGRHRRRWGYPSAT